MADTTRIWAMVSGIGLWSLLGCSERPAEGREPGASSTASATTASATTASGTTGTAAELRRRRSDELAPRPPSSPAAKLPSFTATAKLEDGVVRVESTGPRRELLDCIEGVLEAGVRESLPPPQGAESFEMVFHPSKHDDPLGLDGSPVHQPSIHSADHWIEIKSDSPERWDRTVAVRGKSRWHWVCLERYGAPQSEAPQPKPVRPPIEVNVSLASKADENELGIPPGDERTRGCIEQKLKSAMKDIPPRSDRPIRFRVRFASMPDDRGGGIVLEVPEVEAEVDQAKDFYSVAKAIHDHKLVLGGCLSPE